jgi:hypothetical protein
MSLNFRRSRLCAAPVLEGNANAGHEEDEAHGLDEDGKQLKKIIYIMGSFKKYVFKKGGGGGIEK